MNYTFTLQQKHYNRLLEHLLRDDGKERAAFIISGIARTNEEVRYLSRKVICLDEAMLLSNSHTHVSFDNNHFIKALKEAEAKGFSVTLVHNHPSNVRDFSTTDDEGERNLFQLAFNRNKDRNPYPSLILFPDGDLIGRVWNEDLHHYPITKIRIIGKEIKLMYPDRNDFFESKDEFNRQALAFGDALNQDLQNLKVAIVGCGGTGSAVAMLIARLGIKEICLIDKDKFAKSNINRLHGSTLDDIDVPKVDIIEREILRLGLETKVTKVKDWVDNEDAINELKSSDVIFGCTDDHVGRILLNRLAYFYLIPVIDMGLIIKVNDSIPPKMIDLTNRISYLFPGSDCLLTNKTINLDIAHAESIRRNDPNEYEKLKEEAYVMGEGNPAPSIVTFTTQVATLAVNSLLNRLVQFNSTALHSHEINMIHRNIQLCPGNKVDNDCRICGFDSYWGRGDMEPFLDMTR